LDFVLDLHEDYVKSLLCDVVVGHAEVVGPRERLSLTGVKRPKSLQFVVNRVKYGSVMRMNRILGDRRVKLVVFKLNSK
jgi:hypothetical protein